MYTKLFSSILNSSIWDESDTTRILFVTMLAMADQNGCIYGSMTGLARQARQPLETTKAALVVLMSEDPNSGDSKRNPEKMGRRVEELPEGGGWQLVNYEYYRSLKDADERRANDRERQRRKRAKDKEDASRSVTERHGQSRSVTHNPPSEEIISDQIKSQLNTNTAPSARERKSFRRPEPEEVRVFFQSRGVTGNTYLEFLAHYESNGWRVGKNPMKSWKASAAGWIFRAGAV